MWSDYLFIRVWLISAVHRRCGNQFGDSTSKDVAALGNLVRDLQVECVVLLPPGRGRPLVVSCAALCPLLPPATYCSQNSESSSSQRMLTVPLSKIRIIYLNWVYLTDILYYYEMKRCQNQCLRFHEHLIFLCCTLFRKTCVFQTEKYKSWGK